MERKINGPENEWLTVREAAGWLRVSVPVFKAMVRRGEVPPGVSFGEKTLRWNWLDVVAAAHLRSRLAGGKEDTVSS